MCNTRNLTVAFPNNFRDMTESNFFSHLRKMNVENRNKRYLITKLPNFGISNGIVRLYYIDWLVDFEKIQELTKSGFRIFTHREVDRDRRSLSEHLLLSIYLLPPGLHLRAKPSTSEFAFNGMKLALDELGLKPVCELRATYHHDSEHEYYDSERECVKSHYLWYEVNC